MITQPTIESNHRVRRPGIHRGWALKSMTPERMARDIYNSLQLDRVYDAPQRIPEMFTSCQETLALVHALLGQE